MSKIGIIAKFEFGGKSIWSDSKARTIDIVKITCRNSNKEPYELWVYFDKSWKPKVDGLIYSDNKFESEVNKYLQATGSAIKKVHYSEQGMQTNNYVSFDILR